MSLRDQMLADLDKIFFNTEEFGEVHEIEGEQVACIMQGNIAKDGTVLADWEDTLIISASVCPIAERMPGDVMKIDNKLYEVMTWDKQAGAYYIGLSAKANY